jgi:hypothetical protein
VGDVVPINDVLRTNTLELLDWKRGKYIRSTSIVDQLGE